jgi:release factor glutamine methyltransferase
VLEWATRDFQSRAIESPRLDAELLLSRAIGLDRIRLIVEAARPLDEQELSTFRALIERRRNAEPIAYILGQREFYGLSIRVTPAVLIPRPDTEALVEVALSRTRSVHLSGRALDLCTGSGCVAIAFAKERRTWQVSGSDVSRAAIEMAQDNAIRLGVAHNTGFFVSDLFTTFEKAPASELVPFDLITCNPPYIATEEIATLEPHIKDHEPCLALDGGNDGLDFYRRVIRQIAPFLAEHGVLAFEVGAGQADSVAELMERKRFEVIERKRDYGGHERVVSGRRPKRS